MSTQCVNIEKQGMLSILGSESDQGTLKTAAASIKRTLSADMSSKKWLSKNYSPMKKIASSENLLAISSVVVAESDSSSSSSSDGELEDKKLNKDQPKTFEGWSSILSKKNDQDSPNNVPPPYIHPLVKRSNSTLTKKSLEICTESLGSETGSDCFNSSPSSENEQQQQQQQQQYSSVPQTSEDFQVVKYNNTKRVLSSPRSFPPPLPSVHMQSRRQDGRLILEAVSVPPTNYFNAQRLDGRLLLTYIDQNNECELEMENREGEVEEFEQVFDDIQEVDGHEIALSDNDCDDEDESKEDEDEDDEEEEDEDEDEEEKEDVERKGMCIVMEQSPRLSNEVIVLFENSTLVPHRFNNSINSMMDDSIVRQCYTCPSSVRQSLPSPRRVAQVIPAPPPPPPPAAAASFNTYEYFWRKKPVMSNPIIIDDKCNKNNCYNNMQVEANGTDLKANCTTNKQDLVVIRENKASMNNNNLVPLIRSCKEPRRSLIIREPYCIATS